MVKSQISADNLQPNELKNSTSRNNTIARAFVELEQGVHAALETYSNVHRGSGHYSMVSTHLFEQARDIVLDYLGLNNSKYVVIFCTPRGAEALCNQIEPESYQILSSLNIGLSIGVRALAVKRKKLPKGIPFQTGGGTTRLVSQGWVTWNNAPDKFEAGTPAIINVITFAKVLQLIRLYGNDIFRDSTSQELTASDILYHDELEKYAGQELLIKLRQTLIGCHSVPTMEGHKPFINMDNSASTPTFIPIWDAFRQTWHQHEQLRQEIVLEVKSICAGVLGAPLASYDMVFTSNATEAINLAAESFSRESEKDIESVILSTLLEHSSNDLPWRMIPHNSVIRLSIDAEGFMDMIELEALLSAYNQNNQYGKKRIKLVAISGASNVLGVCNNIAEISQVVHRYGARLLVDAAQLIAHRKIDMEGCGIDYLAFSAHKVYAPFGCGVLAVRKGLLNFSSAEMESIQYSGEENVGGIAALGKILLILQRIGMGLIQEEEQKLTIRALRGMSQIAGMSIYGIKDVDSPGFTQKVGVIVFGLKGTMAPQVAKELAVQSGIGVRCGCHCAHILIKRLLNVSPPLERLQRLIVTLFPKVRLPGLVRVSFAIENSEEDIDTLIYVLSKIAKQPQPIADRSSASVNKETPSISKSYVQHQMNDFVRTAAQKVYSQL